MDKADSRNIKARFWRESFLDRNFENTANSDSQGNSSVENSRFRGFEKLPKVSIEKLNIEPFNNEHSLEYKKVEAKLLNGAYKTLPQLTSSCFVKLVRDDLSKLKKNVIKNSLKNKVKSKGILSMPFLRCNICEKAYSSERKLQNHLENKHMLVYKAGFVRKSQKSVSFSDHVIVHELKEYHRCRKCTRIFEEYQSLKRHMKQEHRKRKCYICHYCSKNFVDRLFFKVHIKHHCDVCGLLLPNKRRYLMHRRNSCRVTKKYTCKTCGNLFFSYMDLKDHSYDHFEELFVCDICKSQHSSKCSASHHICFLHSKHRPKELYTNRNLGNERLYLCNFCEVSSIDRGVIDKHVSLLSDLNNRKRTGFKDYYFCDQCLRKFDSETNMLQHKWSHFLNTYENSQVHSDKRIHQKTSRAKTRNEVRKIFKVYEKSPHLFQPKIVLERIDCTKPPNSIHFVDNNNSHINSGESKAETKEKIVETVSINKATTAPKLKKVDDFIVKKRIIDPQSQEDATLPIKKAKNKLPYPEEVDSTAEKAIVNEASQEVSSTVNKGEVDVTPQEEVGIIVEKTIVDPKSKKTLKSRFQCGQCHKYYSSKYCLNRHILSVHESYSNLQCKDCEETFVWPSLLKSHNCIRLKIPEMPFDDARPEIQLNKYSEFGQAGIDELMNISESEDYMNAVDFEIPAPIVHLTEFQNKVINPDGNCINQNSNYGIPIHNSYKIVMQEVPIEF